MTTEPFSDEVILPEFKEHQFKHDNSDYNKDDNEPINAPEKMNCCTPLNCCRSFHYLSTGEVPYIQFANNCSLKLKQRTPENLLKKVKLYKNK